MAAVNGVILYRGPSELDGKPIVVIAVGLRQASENHKTGAFIQTYILADGGEKPTDAIKSGGDASICGNCPHRGTDAKAGSCYVNAGRVPNAVYAAFQRGAYPHFNARLHRELFRGKLLRLGSYGDPAAVPLSVWKSVCSVVKSWTGYTHQWRTCDRRFAQFCMASCETVEDRRLALEMGYRTFRVRLPEEPVDDGEFVCPASEEAGKRRTCAECKACSGSKSGGANVSPVIIVHGLAWKVTRYRQTLDNLRPDRNGRIGLPLI
jgi:hypothetical protein